VRKDLRNIINALKDKGYVIYDKPYQLNIVGVRNEQSQPNKFDDQLYVFYKDENWNWVLKEVKHLMHLAPAAGLVMLWLLHPTLLAASLWVIQVLALSLIVPMLIAKRLFQART
jgi:hypothetical protein